MKSAARFRSQKTLRLHGEAEPPAPDPFAELDAVAPLSLEARRRKRAAGETRRKDEA